MILKARYVDIKKLYTNVGASFILCWSLPRWGAVRTVSAALRVCYLILRSQA